MLGLEVEPLESSLVVELPIEGKIVLNHRCRGCVIEIPNRQLPFSLVLLDMMVFDIILGMDRLPSYRAIIDCYHRRVTVCTAGGDCFYFLGDRTDRLLPLLYDSRSRGKFTSLLATLTNDGNGGVRGVFPRVVCEYLDVFPEDLTKLLPHREVKFSIDLVPGTAPISMSPYKFAPTELHVLKE
ncbi:uncharacterized protein LOC114284166 [Camellia sinensis]|uniref:uncharacterized protein LOC114284166 n=1 Tax=Camellia sinensis TaxID=4442 RepID=UPI00103658E2|nr:uncharacterized protein LOC114284166 [Camellia sinensis]